MKKLVCAVLCICVFCTVFISCANNGKATVLNISGQSVSDEVFVFFLDKVSSSPKDYSLTNDSTQDEYVQATKRLCAEYFALNTEFEEQGLKLDAEHKTKTAETVSNKWRMSSQYFNAIGVSKQTLTKIYTSNEKKEILFLSLYNEGGSREVDEKQLKDYFFENYISFRAINGYLTTTDEQGNTVSLSKEEQEATRTRFKNMIIQINNGQTIDEVGEAYSKEQASTSTASTVSVLKKDSSEYPKGFFEKVSQLEYEVPTVVEAEDYIFLVMRTDLSEHEEEDFCNYRNSCLKTLKSEDFDRFILDVANSYEINEKTNTIQEVIDNYKKDLRRHNNG
ncbi:MAG TPA: hypothetical protein VFD52_07015 [Clostridia bacterium]|nr:hypothetical protein [Clostridia bacterium]